MSTINEKKGKVLVVDDEPINLEIICHLLQDCVAEVRMASDAASALKVLETFQPDVALLDVMMPGMNGYQLCSLIKRRDSGIKVVMVSARSSAEDRRLGVLAGADDYISKPFNLDDFVGRVLELIQAPTKPHEVLTPVSRVPGRKVLIVDDEPDMLEIIAQVLVGTASEIEKATSPTLALEKLSSFDPDLVLIDVVMPEMDGYTLCQRVKERSPHVRVAFVTASSSANDRARSHELGADEFIPKPFNLEDFVARIRALL